MSSAEPPEKEYLQKQFEQTLRSLKLLPFCNTSTQTDNISADKGTPLVVAYSGGVDSHVLLHLCTRLALPVRAIHVHHGLQAIADDWVHHCQLVCQQLRVPLEIMYVDASHQPRQSPEEAARSARYQALLTGLKADDVLMTAQHADDQAETFLLQLMRGAGAAGLASMSEQRLLSIDVNTTVRHIRPLLDVGRQQIEDYAAIHQLKWVEDPSNRDIKIDRNFIRHELMPLMQTRWPELGGSLCDAAGLQQQNLELIEDMAAIDLTKVSVSDANVLDIKALQRLSFARQMNLLRYWLRKNNVPLISRKLLHELQSSLLAVRSDANPCIKCDPLEIRRYQDRVYLCEPLAEPEVSQTFCWRPSEQTTVTVSGLSLECNEGIEQGLQNWLQDELLEIRFRQGGEVIQLCGHPRHKRVKALFQEAKIPPWLRPSQPLLYYENELVAVAGIGYASKYCVTAKERGWGLSFFR